MRNQKQLRLYLHIPFCVKKCLYCDFLSAPAEEETKELYVQALLQEIAGKAEDYRAYTISSIFIGGGTPSILKASQILVIMSAIRDSYSLEEKAEITIEVNPGTVTSEKIEVYKQAGINRISIGLQSTHNRELEALGRIHTYEEFLESFQIVRNAGIQNINIDLMAALPNQTLADYLLTLKRILALKPEHISAYSLIIEENTPFASRRTSLHLPDEETEREMYELTKKVLGEAGYNRYEISNYALSGRECRHNIGYWKRNHYLGLGIGAASLVENVRWNVVSDLAAYLQGQFTPQDRQELSQKEQMEEFMFLGLRLRQGVSTQEFEKIFCVSLEAVYKEKIDKLSEQKLLERTSQGAVRLTDRGIDISNYVMSEFLF